MHRRIKQRCPICIAETLPVKKEDILEQKLLIKQALKKQSDVQESSTSEESKSSTKDDVEKDHDSEVNSVYIETKEGNDNQNELQLGEFYAYVVYLCNLDFNLFQ